MENKKSLGSILAIVGGAGLSISAFLSWASVSIDLEVVARVLGVPAGTIGSIPGASQSAQGVDGWEGKVAVAAGIVAIVIGVITLREVRKGLGVLLVVAGIAGGGVALYDVATAKSQVQKGFNAGLDEFRPQLEAQGIDTSALDDALIVSLDAGIWICVISGIVVLAAGLLVRSTEQSAPSTAAVGLATGGFGSPTAPGPQSAPPMIPLGPQSAPPMTPASPTMPLSEPTPPPTADGTTPEGSGSGESV